MEVNPQNIQQLAAYLQQTLSPQNEIRKPAEQFLQSVEANQNYPVLLLHLLQSDGAELNIKVAGSVTFKNYIKRNWAVTDEGGDKVHASDRDAVKTLIIDLMLKSPGPVQKQLSEAISIIGKQDFPERWQNLIPDMVSRFASGDFHIINGVLQTAHSIFEKYTVEFKSQKLWEEIKFVLDNFAKPLTELFTQTIDLAAQHANNKDALKVIFGSLSYIAKIFYSLNYQDLPEFFEDNMSTWMPRFHDLLTLSNPLLTTDDDEPGVLEELRSQICDNIALYAFKYEEEFQPFMSQFVTAVWNLLLSTGAETKYDLLVSNAIEFLASVANRPHYKNLFEDDNVLSSICEKIIVPNMEMRECDVEMFEDNPEEFIRRDLEGSDVDTRRRAACDLVKGLTRHFEQRITNIFGTYVNTMLQQYNANPANWKSKDAALYLVTSLAAKAKTARHGITQTNELVNLSEFCTNHVMPELTNLNNASQLPIVKADCIKYVMVFKSQLNPEAVKSSLPALVQLLNSQSVVVHTYAAAAIEKILIMKNGEGKALVTSQELSPLAENLLKSLFSAFDKPGSSENEYVMKAVMRSFSALQESVVPYLAHLLPPLTTKLTQAAKNPTRPHYNHYLFESLSLSIRIVCKTNPGAVASFEQVLFPVFEEILKTDVQEFVPYVFQIMSLMLELHSSGTVPDQYMAIFPFLLMPLLWERPGNIHPLVRLIQAFISRGPGQVVSHISGLLGVFQKLIASKNNDHEGFYLLQSMVEHLPPDSLSNFLKQVFIVLFQRLTSTKTTKYVKSLLVFFFVFVIKNGGATLIQMIDSIQPGMFGMVCDSLIVKDGTVQKISGVTEKKISAVGITKLLTETPDLFGGNYSNKFVPLLQALIALFELPEDSSIPDDEHFIEIEDTPGYQTAYSQLIFAGKADRDPAQLAGVDNPRHYLVQNLARLSNSAPGQVPGLIQQLPDQARQFLVQYSQQAGMSLSIVEYFAEHSGYKCGYCGQDDTNFSHGMWAHTLTTQDYQDLIDRGWRRSGQYCYKPTMNKTCCPLYTIKCEALKFKPSKSQKKVVKRFVNYILHDVHSGNKKDATDDDNDGEESLVCSETMNQKNEEMEGKVQLKNVEQLEISEKNDEISSPVVTATLSSSTVEPTATDCDNQNLEKKGKHPIGMDPSKPKQGKAKIRRLEKWKAKHGDADEKLIKSKNQEKSVEDLLLPLENAKDSKHKWEIRLVHAHDSDKVFSSTLKETVSVYQKYQQVIHNDSPDKCTEKQFKRFLCNSPLQPGDSGPPHGSYHYQYCIDGEIFAVGVLDILPHCVSSVYLYYDPKYSFLSPGTLTSLLEIALVSCVKMKYKGRYSPSLLLCPETYNWRPLPDCLPLLDSAPYSRLETDPGKTDKDSSIELSRVGVLYCRQATNYQNYQRLVEQEEDDSDSDAVDDKEEVLEYAGLVGNTIAKRMLLYRTG